MRSSSTSIPTISGANPAAWDPKVKHRGSINNKTYLLANNITHKPLPLPSHNPTNINGFQAKHFLET